MQGYRPLIRVPACLHGLRRPFAATRNHLHLLTHAAQFAATLRPQMGLVTSINMKVVSIAQPILLGCRFFALVCLRSRGPPGGLRRSGKAHV